MVDLRVDALVMHPANGLVIEGSNDVEAFCVSLGADAGFIEFKCVQPGVFQSARWLADLTQAQGPAVSSLRVLWPRRAVLSGDPRSASFPALEGPTPGSLPQSGS